MSTHAPSLRTALADGVARARAAAGLSLEQVARKIGITKQAVHGLERGGAGDVVDRYQALLGACGVEVYALLVERDDAAAINLAQAVAELPPEAQAVAARLLRALAAYPPAERELLAWTAEVRLDAINGVPMRALPGR